MFSQMFPGDGITSFLIFRDDYFNCTKQDTERCECVKNVAKKRDLIKNCNAASKNFFNILKTIQNLTKRDSVKCE